MHLCAMQPHPTPTKIIFIQSAGLNNFFIRQNFSLKENFRRHRRRRQEFRISGAPEVDRDADEPDGGLRQDGQRLQGAQTQPRNRSRREETCF